MIRSSNPSILRRVYDGLSLFALLNIIGLVGLLALLGSKGTISIEKMRRIVGVMRGEESSSVLAVEQNDAAEAVPAGAGDIATSLDESDTGIQIMRLEGERIRAELDQRLALNNSILLRVTTERERFQRERDAAEKQQDRARRKRQTDGFKKQIAIYEALSPKVAIEHLLSLSDPADAAAVFLEMDTRKAKKIIEAAKRDDQKERVIEILKRIREIESDTFDDLNEGGG